MIEVIDNGRFLTFRPAVNPQACRKEYNEQVDFVAWVRLWFPLDAAMMIHPANEGDVAAQHRQAQIKAGLLKGASDILLLRSAAWPCALLEFKQCKHRARPTTEQAALLEAARLDGKFSALVNGADAAKCAFMAYKKGWTILDGESRVLIPEIEFGDPT